MYHTLSVIGARGQVDLVGSSFGAVVALHLAASYPARVRTLTLFESPSFWILPDAEYERDAVAREMRDLTNALTPSAAPSDEQLYRFRCLLGACPLRLPTTRTRLALSGISAVLRCEGFPRYPRIAEIARALHN